MKILYSSFNGSGSKFNRLWLAIAVIIFALAAYVVYWVLKFAFYQGFFLGIVFLFFGLPIILRLFFISVLSLLSFFGQNKQRTTEDNDSVIDVKGKVIK